MCDRILVLGSNPGHIAAEIRVPLPQPRDRLDTAFRAIVDQIYSILTSRMAESIGAQSKIHGGLVQRLPDVSINRIGGFIETLASPAYGGHTELAKIAESLALKINNLFPIAAALHILEFAELKDGTIKLTAAGRVFAQSGTEDRKRLFKEHLLRFVPLVAHIRQVLDDREDHHAPLDRFEFELEDHLNRSDADQTLRSVINWGRYAELFTYDDQTRTFGLAANWDRTTW
jgi:NitT/TauT family transport system ATP-binding protein